MRPRPGHMMRSGRRRPSKDRGERVGRAVRGQQSEYDFWKPSGQHFHRLLDTHTTVWLVFKGEGAWGRLRRKKVVKYMVTREDLTTVMNMQCNTQTMCYRIVHFKHHVINLCHHNKFNLKKNVSRRWGVCYLWSIYIRRNFCILYINPSAPQPCKVDRYWSHFIGQKTKAQRVRKFVHRYLITTSYVELG